MDLIAAILIGVAIGIWLAVMVLFFLVQSGWVPPENETTVRAASPRPGSRTERRSRPLSAAARDAADAPAVESPSSRDDRDPPGAGPEAVSGLRVTYAEVDRASKGDPGVARHLRYLRLHYQGDEDAIMETIRAAETMSPQADVGDWVVAAARRVESLASAAS